MLKDMFDMDICYFLNCFCVYSFLGWLFECMVMTYENRSVTNRGFAKGPYCPIYACGALSIYFFLKPIAGHYVAIFVCGMIMATTLEYITAKIMTRLFGGFWWDYNNKKFNYRGVICLESSLCWGLMALCTFILFQPAVEKIVNTYFASYGKHVAIVFLLVYMLDFTTSFRRARKESKAKNSTDELQYE